ncbi:hypothetical protein ABZX40_36455 [Streptomyces sp. NPDC004610]|uniref:hypothetical protein n=1 Tax=unclassified Streptomyces TaxID=2593676 RepID=UPI0033A38784
METQQHDHDDVHYIVSTAGTALSGARCEHGDTAVDVILTGTPCQPGALPDHINALVPRCGFTAIVGAVIAQIHHHEGAAAAEHFIDQVHLAQATAHHQIEQNAR